MEEESGTRMLFTVTFPTLLHSWPLCLSDLLGLLLLFCSDLRFPENHFVVPSRLPAGSDLLPRIGLDANPLLNRNLTVEYELLA